ncbi:MAG: aspartyl protease family protein [Cyclobacteriaceae bacterium]
MRLILIACLLIANLSNVIAQLKIGLFLPQNESRITVPFKFINNLIVVPVTINNQITLNYILDTGANTPILTERLFGDIMGLEYARTMMITGPGMIDSIQAHVANGISLNLPNGIRGRNMSMLVLEKDYIELKKNLGEELYGIIGFDVFKRFIVEIDYENREVTFHEPSMYKGPSRKYREFDLMLDGTKPYLNTLISQGDKSDTVKLMIDTGASHALLLDLTMSSVLTVPDTTIQTSLGHGLGGEISGRIGRIDQLKMGHYTLNDVLVSIPDPGAYSNAIKRGSRNGTIGGNALSRFNVIFDYLNYKLYLTRNKSYGEKFEYDMSGMRISFYENPKRLEVTGIMKNSPASKLPVQVGDEVVSINGHNLQNSKLSDIYSVLRSKNGRKVRIKIIKNDQLLEYRFRLTRMI